MKIHTVAQGTAEWFALRLGIPTASEFDKIVTPGGILSGQSRKYAFRLVTEQLLGRPLESLEGMEWMERGKELEPAAVRMYEFEQDVQTEAIGFVTTDDGRMGCSPDRMVVGKAAGVEIKCPAPHTHVEYMLDGFGAKYVPQVQGQLLVTGWEWVDRYSYHPEMPPVMLRTYRNEKYLATLREALEQFCEMKDAMLALAKERGMFAERRTILSPADAEYEEHAQ